MKPLLETGLIIAGISMAMLCIASFWIPKALGWKEKLTSLTPLMKELWWTYSIYVWGSHVFFTVIMLGHPGWLMSGSGSAIAMCSFILIWWSIRLYLQFFGFDLSEVKPTRFNRLAKHLLTCLFIGLVTLFALLLCWNLGYLPSASLT